MKIYKNYVSTMHVLNVGSPSPIWDALPMPKFIVLTLTHCVPFPKMMDVLFHGKYVILLGSWLLKRSWHYTYTCYKNTIKSPSTLLRFLASEFYCLLIHKKKCRSVPKCKINPKNLIYLFVKVAAWLESQAFELNIKTLLSFDCMLSNIEIYVTDWINWTFGKRMLISLGQTMTLTVST